MVNKHMLPWLKSLDLDSQSIRIKFAKNKLSRSFRIPGVEPEKIEHALPYRLQVIAASNAMCPYHRTDGRSLFSSVEMLGSKDLLLKIIKAQTENEFANFILQAASECGRRGIGLDFDKLYSDLENWRATHASWSSLAKSSNLFSG